jgi:hypothetical protein
MHEMHRINWYAGWAMILTAFVTGAAVGCFFRDEDFLGGYASFRRRLLRLGHIALAALGSINLLFCLSGTSDSSFWPQVGSLGFLIGGITMPAVCFLTSWRARFRYLFFIPVGALLIAVIETLRVGPP